MIRRIQLIARIVLLRLALPAALSGLLPMGAAAQGAADALTWLPGDVDAVITLDAARLPQGASGAGSLSEWMQMMNPKSQSMLALLKSRGGFDPSRDLDSVAVGLYLSRKWTTGGDPTFIGVFTGQFTAAKLPTAIASALATDGVRVQQSAHGDVTLYADGVSGATYWAIPRDGIAVFGSSKIKVQSLIEAIRRNAPRPLRPKLRSLLDSTSGNGAVRGAVAFPDIPVQADDPLTAARDVVFGADMARGLNFSGRMTFTDATHALRARNQIVAFQGIIGLALGQNARLEARDILAVQRMLKKIKADADGLTLSFQIDLTDAECRSLRTIAGQMN